jgi:hypothetical protein
MKREKKTIKNFENIKIFVIAFIAFAFANYFYNNIVTKSTANSVKFRDVEVKIVGDINLELNCKGANNPNPSSVNRGIGENTSNECSGKGTFSATVPQQRFVEQ